MEGENSFRKSENMRVDRDGTKEGFSVMVKVFFFFNGSGSYQLQRRQLFSHAVDLNVALLAHIIHLWE